MIQKDQTFGVYEKEGDICSLKSIVHLIDVSDFVLKRTIIQEFENAKKKAVEMEYKFCEGKGQTVNSVEVELFDPKKNERKVLKAQIEGREEAQEKYDDALAEGKSAMLAEKGVNDDRITLCLGNISPGVQVKVRMESVEEIKAEKTAETNNNQVRMKIKIPSLNYSGKQIEKAENNVCVECTIQMTSKGTKIRKIFSPSHPKSFELHQEFFDQEFLSKEEDGETEDDDDEKLLDQNKAILRTSEPVNYNRDIDIDILVSDLPLISGRIERNRSIDLKIPKMTRHSQNYIASIDLIPNFQEKSAVKTELIAIVDCSGSMSGKRMVCARSALLKFFQKVFIQYAEERYQRSIAHEIKVNVVRFGSRYESLYKKTPKSLTRETYKQIKSYLESTNSNLGGTDILSPVKYVLSQPVTTGFTRQCLLLTDGEDSNTSKIVNYCRTNANSTRFFSFGIGKGINPVLIDRIAQNTEGRAVFIENSSDIESKILEQVTYALQPAVQNIEVKFENNVGSKCVTETIPAAYNLQKQCLYYFLDVKEEDDDNNMIDMNSVSQKVPKRCSIKYSIGTKQQQHEIELKNVTRHHQNLKSLIGTIAAKKRVEELEQMNRYMKQKNNNAKFKGVQEYNDEIKSLGLRFGFMSSQTSFLMVDESSSEHSISEPIRSQTLYEEIKPVQIRQSQQQPSSQKKKKKSSGCFANSMNVKIIQTNNKKKIITVNISDVKVGDYIESFDDDHKLIFSRVFSVIRHQRTPKYIVNINDGLLKLTETHLIHIIRNGDEMLVSAEQLSVHTDSIKTYDHENAKFVSIRIQSLEMKKSMEMVTNVYSMNGKIVVNGVQCSVFSSDLDHKYFGSRRFGSQMFGEFVTRKCFKVITSVCNSLPSFGNL